MGEKQKPPRGRGRLTHTARLFQSPKGAIGRKGNKKTPTRSGWGRAPAPAGLLIPKAQNGVVGLFSYPLRLQFPPPLVEGQVLFDPTPSLIQRLR